MSSTGLQVSRDRLRAPTRPEWVPGLSALLRLAAAVLLLTNRSVPALVCALAAGLVTVRPRLAARTLAALPGVGGKTSNVVAHVHPVAETPDPPIVVTSHLDTHRTDGRPLHPIHVLAIRVATVAVVGATAFGAIANASVPAWAGALLAAEGAATTIVLLALAGRGGSRREADDSGIAALLRAGELLSAEPPIREVWLVATGAATCGGAGMHAFLDTHRKAAQMAWVVEVDALGVGEIVLAPARQRVPRAETPPAVLRAVAGAAIDTGDPIDIRRRARPHSDAAVALRRGAPACTITAGVRPPGDEGRGDEANAERAARIVERVARTTL